MGGICFCNTEPATLTMLLLPRFTTPTGLLPGFSSMALLMETSAMTASTNTWARRTSNCWMTVLRERMTSGGAVMTRRTGTRSLAWA